MLIHETQTRLLFINPILVDIVRQRFAFSKVQRRDKDH